MKIIAFILLIGNLIMSVINISNGDYGMATLNLGGFLLLGISLFIHLKLTN